MPLEQIRPSIQLYRAEKAKDQNQKHNSLRLDDDDEEDEEGNQQYEPIRLSRPENMNLLKLGGVGGVTRSGSWGRHQTNTRGGTLGGTLSFSPEEDESATLASDEGDIQTELETGRFVRAQSIGGHEHHRKGVIDHFRSCSSDVPSSSSRTSTSSYSAAAFSLRSVSNRNSVSSTSSSGASSSRSPTAASEDESTATNTSNRVSQLIASPTSTDNPITLESDSLPSSPKSTIPSPNKGSELLERDMSNDTLMYSPGDETTNILGHDAEEGEKTVTQDEEVEDQEMTMSPSHSSELRSSLPLEPPNRPSSSSPNFVSQQQMNGLKLSAAAVSPSFAPTSTSTSTFIPSAPRRHTGAFALRTQSALSQSGGAYGAFSGGGGGRAAAREMARNGNSFDNAPFSELEARRAMTQSSPGRKTSLGLSVLSQPNTPLILRGVDSNDSPGSNSSMLQEDWTPTEQNKLHLPDAASSSTSESSPRLASPIAWSSLRDLSTNTSNLSPLLVDGDRRGKSAARFPPSPIDIEAASAAPLLNPLSSSISRTPGLGISSDGGITKNGRPSLTHSSSGSVVTTNVLRTPTTEEWSRFLAKQGLDPALVAANNGASRARTSTGRSNTSQRKRQHTDRLMNLTLTPTGAISDFAAAAASTSSSQHLQPKDLGERRGSAVSIDTASSDDNSDEQELMESLRQMGLSRPVPTKASSLLCADDLSMLHEEYEDDQGSDGGEGDSSSDERMQALHEAISRPPSRHGSPPLSPLQSDAEEIDESHNEIYKRMTKQTDREVAAAVMGYPSLPAGQRRKIDDFVILSDMGRGAYGLVKKVQLKDRVTGQGVGKEFCIKYIIKSRILADCWRRHKVLGPIPIEIHVMDQLRRLPYKPSMELPPWSVEQLLNLQVTPTDNVGHPSLCKMLDFFEDREFYYMVMPCFGKGQDLFDHVESQPHGLSSLQVRCIFGQVADGLRFLHQNNIVHRDVKDENVILDGRGHVQIIDFGSAAHVNKNGRLFDTFSGTLDYAAAEILKGEKYGGKEQDVWALGVVGYVLLCGDCPFWNGEEAIQGLTIESRAYHVLQDRCQPLAFTSSNPEEERLLGEEIEKRTSDLLGQVDGGGKIEDAADLIENCLEVEAAMRPSMELICQHRFLVGEGGWHGRTGWKERPTTTAGGYGLET